jgi:hypothetical protein
LISIFGIVFLDDDPRGVSVQEWIFFVVMIYAAVAIFRGFQEYLRNGGG